MPASSRIIPATCALMVIFACFAGIGSAQDQPAHRVFIPEWQGKLPHTGGEYPTRAARSNKAGMAVLCCSPTASTGIACRIAAEDSPNYYFGAAAERISQRLRLTPASAATFRENPQEIELAFTFRLTGRREDRRRTPHWNIVHTGVCPTAATSP
jgi:hypothetical protein